MNSKQNVRQTAENPPPRIWDIPVELRRRLSARVGRQRSISVEGHLVMVLHRPPDSRSARTRGVYFWRSPQGEWFHSDQGSGFAALEGLVEVYEARVEDLEKQNEIAESTKSWFAILDQLGPLLRAARNFHDALNQARDQTTDIELRSQLQLLCDHASEIVRTAELLQLDVQNSIQYSMARQAELQAGFSRVQSVASHRLNILAAVFLPLATISSVFGMNLTSGIEHWPPLLFWFVMLCGIGLGTLIGVFVMNIRGLKPEEW